MDGFYPPMPEEEREELQRQAELQEMAMSDFNHSFQTLFEELGLDNLKTVKTMMHFIVGSSGNPLAGQWEGMIAWEMKRRFNICITCGVDHDKELTPDEAPPEENSEPVWPTPYVSSPPVAPPYPMPAAADLVPEEEPIVSEPRDDELTPEELEQMEMYHLDDVRIEETNAIVGFICTGINGTTEGCGMRYPTITDRMKNGPEECSGCFVRAAHG